MSEPYVGEIRMFAGTFAPRGWALCDGQLLSVTGNDALFSLLGTIYGGDGRATFGLPDLRGRIPLHQGSGPGLSPRKIGAEFGEQTETLAANEVASHSHSVQVSSAGGTQNNPAGSYVAASPTVRVYRPGVPTDALDSAAVTPTGGGQSHDNMMPFLCVTFIIALVGVFPSRN